MARRYIPPIPLEILMDDPRTIALSSTGMGALIRLAWHFWRTECRPLPTDRVQLFSLSQANRPTWGVYRDEIMAIMSDASPKLSAAWELRKKRFEHMRSISERGAGVRTLRAIEGKSTREQAKREQAAAPVPAARLPETVRAARVAPPVVSGRIDKGFSDRKAG